MSKCDFFSYENHTQLRCIYKAPDDVQLTIDKSCFQGVCGSNGPLVMKISLNNHGLIYHTLVVGM